MPGRSVDVVVLENNSLKEGAPRIRPEVSAAEDDAEGAGGEGGDVEEEDGSAPFAGAG